MKKGMVALFTVLLFTAYQVSAENPGHSWGAAAAQADAAPQITDMLRYAIEDEYLAHAEYAAIMKKFGPQRPFSNIINAEEQHISWLKDAYKSRGLPVPEDRASDFVKLPDSVSESLKTGIQAEIDNIAMYDKFINSPELQKKENKLLRDLFIRLRDASKNHLSAFKRSNGGQ